MVRFFKLRHLKLLPYSSRRGGATWDFRMHGQIERSLSRGRAASTRTARIYITTAQEELAALRLTDSLVLKLRDWADTSPWN